MEIIQPILTDMNTSYLREVKVSNKEIETKLLEIYPIVSNINELGISLAGGKSGIALFLFYYYRHFKEENAANIGLKLLYDCITDVEQGATSYSYCNGLAGFGTVLQLLCEKEILDINVEEVIGDFDDYLSKKMFEYLEQGNIDFLHGSLGIAYYFLKRGKEKIVMEFIIKLIDKSEKNLSGIFWEVEIDVGEKKERGVNYGLAHGMFSIVSFFNQVILSGRFVQHNRYLKDCLSEIGNFILAGKLRSTSVNTFPTWNTPSNKMNFSRLSWCYGDVSAGLTILQSAIVTKNEYLYKESIEILNKTLKRIDVERESVIDAGFCHGSSGLSHLYYKIYKLTGVEEFHSQSDYWLEVTFKKASHADGYAGYKTFYQNQGWKSQVGVLEGVSGIGLVLLSRLDDTLSDWDHLFLI